MTDFVVQGYICYTLRKTVQNCHRGDSFVPFLHFQRVLIYILIWTI